MVRLVLAAAVALSSCGSPCHQGHTVIRYIPAHSTTQHIKTGEHTSVPITTHHPARCAQRWVCDVSCETWDTGSSEAHPAHSTHRGKRVVSRHCEFDAGRWEVAR